MVVRSRDRRRPGGASGGSSPASPPNTIYVDLVAGSDANNGLTTGAPKLTVTAGLAALSPPDRRILLLQGGQVSYRSIIVPDGVTIGSYGTGNHIVTACRSIVPGAITANANSGAWDVTVTHEVTTAPTGDSDSNTCHFMMWDGPPNAGGVNLGDYPSYDGANRAGDQAFVAANAGRFTVYRQGSSVRDPSDVGEAGTTFVYTFHRADGADPRTTGTMYYAEQTQALSIGTNNGGINKITAARTAGKDLSGATSEGTLAAIALLKDYTVKDAVVHGWVGYSRRLENFTATGLQQAYDWAGGGATFYWGGPMTAGIDVVGANITRFWYGLYWHGNGDTPYQHQFVNASSLTIDKCEYVTTGAGTRDGVVVDGVTATNTNRLVDFAQNYIGRNINLSTPSTSGGGGSLIQMFGDVLIEDSTFTKLHSADWFICQNDKAFLNSDSASEVTLTLRRVTAQNFKTAPPNALWRRVRLVLDGCVLSDLGDGATYPFLSITATGSTFGLNGRSLAQIQADWPGVDGTNTILTSTAPTFVNGDFSTGDLTGWSVQSGTPSVSGGKVTLNTNSDGSVKDMIYQAIAFQAGNWTLHYSQPVSIMVVDARVGTGPTNFSLALDFQSGAGSHSIDFTTTTQTVYFTFSCADTPGSVDLDNFTITAR